MGRSTTQSVIVRRVEPVLVTRRNEEACAELARIEAATPEAFVDVVASSDDPASILAVVDAAVAVDAQLDHEQLVALVSVLVMHGVEAFETGEPRTVRRILDTHAAISAGEIEVLAP